ncbi:MAG: hypothetical protein WC358_09995 [Ignavibacteria bacterium]|jgi:hypothetical protein
MIYKLIVTVLIIFLDISIGFSQDYKENKTKEYFTWGLMQMIPSPTLYQDTDGNNSRVQFGLKWQIIPINISFKTNKYVSNSQFFMINPVRRFTGSIETFIQPEITIAEFKYSNIKSFGVSTGSRLMFPLVEYGENLSGSLGMKYTFRKSFDEVSKGYAGLEAGIYIFGGMIGLQYTQNFNSRTNYNVSLYIKYF